MKKLQPIYLGLQNRLSNYSNYLRYRLIEIVGSKPKLLGLISVVTIVIFVPLVIIPHMQRPYLIYFISMHVASIAISSFLIIASLLAYYRTGSSKILYTTVGFSSLLIVELFFLLQVIPGTSTAMQRGLYVGLPHILLLLMLTLFGLGVLKVEK
jgi:membrane-associated HD superfamily phosphohydrolase